MRYFYHVSSGEKAGPFSASEIKKLAKDGVIQPLTTIENEIGGQIFQARKITGIVFAEHSFVVEEEKKLQTPVPPVLIIAAPLIFGILLFIGWIVFDSANAKNVIQQQVREIAAQKEQEKQEREREKQRQREEEEKERQAQEEEKKRIAEEQERREQERLAQEEQERKKQEQLAQERQEQEQKRLERERLEQERRAAAVDLYAELCKKDFYLDSLITDEKTFFRDYNYSVKRNSNTSFEISIDTGFAHPNSIDNVSFPMQGVNKTSNNLTWLHSIRFSVSGNENDISELIVNKDKYLARVYFSNLRYRPNDPPSANV